MFKRLAFIPLLLLTTNAVAATAPIEGDIVGSVTSYKTKAGDSLFSVGRQHDTGIVEMIAANPGVDAYEPPADTTLTIPAAHILPPVKREGIVINLAELRLYYFPDAHTVMTFPITVGKEGWETPSGETAVHDRRDHPTWYAPESILKEEPEMPRMVPPGPMNPLGDYAINLGWPGYRIHGTNVPESIGKWASHGCIRLYPEDIDTLFHTVNVGTPVRILNKPYRLGWQGKQLFLQVTPTLKQAYEIVDSAKLTPVDIPAAYGDVQQLAGSDAAIDWAAVKKTLAERSGLPVAVATKK